MTDGEWLAGLKAGDEVLVTAASAFISTRVGTVKRRTPKGMLVVDCGEQEVTFYGDRGSECARGYRIRRLAPVTPEARAEIEAAALGARLAQVRWEGLPVEVLRRVVEALEES